ncbi:MAG: hypothetical protein IRY91_09825, partial [Gemmatimonadaceae bacterium]|nr:hypothetical protein [Gemmatimonadaceae bacterium]
PTLSPQWVPTPAIMPMAEAVSVPCADEGELHAQLGAVLAGGYHVPEATHTEIDDVIRDWFHCVDGEAHERVAAAVMAAVNEHRTVRYAACKQHLHGVCAEGGGEGTGLSGLGRRLRYRLGLSPEWSFRHFREVPTAGFAGTDQAYDLPDVHQTLAQIAERDRRIGRPAAPPISAARARDAGEYVHRYAGQSIVLTRRPSSGGATETIT